MRRVTIQNHWDPVRRCWTFDRGMRIDVGTTAEPNKLHSAAMITDAGEDFIVFEQHPHNLPYDVHFLSPEDPGPDPSPTGGTTAG